ncbi:hypothetical protein FIBSPDRAFT_1045702 [Athelia psychrophila]|uniref:C2H2-type domain-containing protein n=1 Tax=Athelia psychrophila TaxID=1759441 RepID=A0A166HQD2_9AGAM|nr:hypothetical protein FIBSPDRAFT_1045702 [Fibularhizoctonia sp. CBS 109695]
MYPPDHSPQSTGRSEVRPRMQSDWIETIEQPDFQAYICGLVEGATFLQSTHLPKIFEWIGNVEEDSRDMAIQMAYMRGFVEGASWLQPTMQAASSVVAEPSSGASWLQPTVMQAASSVVAEPSSGAPAHSKGTATISSPVRIFCNGKCGVPACQKDFKRPWCLDRHVREEEARRTGNRPYECGCGLRFMRSAALKKHKEKENH